MGDGIIFVSSARIIHVLERIPFNCILPCTIKNALPLGGNYYCPATQFRCYDGSCLPNHYRCNGRFDCPSGEDELNCSMWALFVIVVCVCCKVGKLLKNSEHAHFKYECIEISKV